MYKDVNLDITVIGTLSLIHVCVCQSRPHIVKDIWKIHCKKWYGKGLEFCCQKCVWLNWYHPSCSMNVLICFESNVLALTSDYT